MVFDQSDAGYIIACGGARLAKLLSTHQHQYRLNHLIRKQPIGMTFSVPVILLARRNCVPRFLCRHGKAAIGDPPVWGLLIDKEMHSSGNIPQHESLRQVNCNVIVLSDKNRPSLKVLAMQWFCPAPSGVRATSRLTFSKTATFPAMLIGRRLSFVTEQCNNH